MSHLDHDEQEEWGPESGFIVGPSFDFDCVSATR